MSLGPQKTVSTPVSQAAALYEAGEVDEAIQAALEAINDARQLDENSLQLVDALTTFADIQRQEGDFEKAESLYLEALEAAEKIAAPLEQLAELRSHLATLYDFSQREEQAIPLYERAIADYESLKPGHDSVVAQLRNNLAMIYKSLGRHALAEQHYLQALDVLEKKHGRFNERVAAIFNNLGSLYYTAGFADQAKQMHLDALEVRIKVLGPNDPEVAQSYCNLATACYTLDDMSGMQENYEKSLDILGQHISENAETYQTAVEDYVAALESIGETKKALVVKRHSEKMLRKL